MKIHRLDFETAKGNRWTMTPIDLDDTGLSHKIMQSISKNSGLMSSDKEFVFDLDSGEGQIIVGGGRVVGSIKLTTLEVSE